MWWPTVLKIRAMSNLDPIRSKRVPRFVEEYVKDRNGTQAAVRAGYTQNQDSARVIACRLLADVNIQALVAAEQAKVTQEARIEAADILKEYLTLASADPSKLMQVRRVNCRHCWGVGHQYQWKASEYAKACDAATRPPKKGEAPRPFPDCSGGFGFRHNGEPNPECPECDGEGVEDVFFRDTESVTGPERKLIAGVRRTRDGIELKLRDQDGALKILAQYAGLLIDRKELSGKDGGPIALADPSKLAGLTERELSLYGELLARLVGGTPKGIAK